MDPGLSLTKAMRDLPKMLQKMANASFRTYVEETVNRLRRMQVVCLPVIFLAPAGLLLTWEKSLFLRLFLQVIALVAILVNFYCRYKAEKLACPKCHKKIAYLLLDPSYSKTEGPWLLPKGLPPEMHQCPYCHADWEQEEQEQRG